MGRKRILHDPRAEIIRKMVGEGRRDHEIGAQISLTKKRVQQIRTAYGIPSTRQVKRERTTARIDELLQKRVPIGETTRRADTYPQKVSAQARKLGVAPVVAIPSVAWRVLADLLSTDDSLAEIGCRHNMTTQHVWDIQKRAEEAGIRVSHRKKGSARRRETTITTRPRCVGIRHFRRRTLNPCTTMPITEARTTTSNIIMLKPGPMIPRSGTPRSKRAEA
jgi:hypothetical protein